MHRKSLVLILALWLVPCVVHAGVLINASFEDGMSPFGGPYYGGASIVSDSTAPDGTHSLMFTFPSGLYGGQAPDIINGNFTESNEVWVQYYVKYSSNWVWNSIGNKQIYMLTGAQGSQDMNFFIMAYSQWGDTINFSTQQPADASLNQTFRSSGWTLTTNAWHKVVIHVSMNTAGMNNGIAQVWVDDILRIDVSNVLYRRSGQSTGFDQFQMTPVFGGGAENIPTQQYMWFDYVIVQTTPITGSSSASPDASKTPSSPSGLMITN